MNNNLNRKFTSPKWEAKNTYLVMLTRRIFGGLARRTSGGIDLKFLVNSLGLPR
jgi:hypothetical protein